MVSGSGTASELGPKLPLLSNTMKRLGVAQRYYLPRTGVQSFLNPHDLGVMRVKGFWLGPVNYGETPTLRNRLKGKGHYRPRAIPEATMLGLLTLSTQCQSSD